MKRVFFLLTVLMLTVTGSNLAFAADSDTNEETHTLILRRIDDPTEYHDYYWEVETEPGQIEEGMNIMGVGVIPLDRFDEEDKLFVIPDKDIKMNFLDGRFGLTKELLLSDDFESMEITYTLDDVLAYGKYKKQKLGLTSEDSENQKAAEENINKSETEIYDSQEKFDSITKILMGISPIITHIIWYKVWIQNFSKKI